jgi:hypothetical protein
MDLEKMTKLILNARVNAEQDALQGNTLTVGIRRIDARALANLGSLGMEQLIIDIKANLRDNRQMRIVTLINHAWNGAAIRVLRTIHQSKKLPGSITEYIERNTGLAASAQSASVRWYELVEKAEYLIYLDMAYTIIKRNFKFIEEAVDKILANAKAVAEAKDLVRSEYKSPDKGKGDGFDFTKGKDETSSSE